MANTPEPEDAEVLPAEEAFALLGDETRLDILQRLGEADEPLAFSELFRRVEYEGAGNFSYHLDRLQDHFVTKTDDGYVLRQAGRRVVEAVLSGTVTDGPVVERTETDLPCFLCESTMEVAYRQENLAVLCSDCAGTRGSHSSTAGWVDDPKANVVGHVTLPPAGVHDRTPTELLRAAEVWTVAEVHATARGVCPRCSASVEPAVAVCEDHDATADRCERCDQRFAVTLQVTCSNCIFEEESAFTKYLLADEAMMAFMIDHGVDPLAPDGFHVSALEETSVRADPFEARFTFVAGGDALTLAVDADLTVEAVPEEATVSE